MRMLWVVGGGTGTEGNGVVAAGIGTHGMAVRRNLLFENAGLAHVSSQGAWAGHFHRKNASGDDFGCGYALTEMPIASILPVHVRAPPLFLSMAYFVLRTIQNTTEQNRTEQNRTEQNRTEQNKNTNGADCGCWYMWLCRYKC